MLRAEKVACAGEAFDGECSRLLETINAWIEESSAKEVAEVIGVSAQYLSDIRHGRRKVSDEFVERLRGMSPGGKQ